MANHRGCEHMRPRSLSAHIRERNNARRLQQDGDRRRRGELLLQGIASSNNSDEKGQ